MPAFVRVLLYLLLGVPLTFLLLHTIIRVIRHVIKFPIPAFLAGAIDNPLRRRIQPPDHTAVCHGIEPGMTVLEIGPGNGTYTMAAARLIGPEGTLVTIDIEPKMIEGVKMRAAGEGITNLHARTANVFDLPFEDRTFDVIYMITVIGEIPTPEKALLEFHRVLKPGGTLSFSEILLDPDYPLASTLEGLAVSNGFQLKERLGTFFCYTLQFEKASQ